MKNKKQTIFINNFLNTYFLILTLFIISLDQISKYIVVQNLVLGESLPNSGFFRLTHAQNTGTAFSLFQNQTDILTIVSFVAIVMIIFIYISIEKPSKYVYLSYGLLFGGAFGNLIDRVRLGYVTDFFDVGFWPIFNIADSAITIGIILMLFNYLIFNNNNEEN
ncbi:MAG: signal peptidase II [Chloroflexi bacterium]|nr:signal peptidase II [Chloroflexota bacterium]|tara:strand:- start:587 stop:1078 length:492 start_codon:yes stop_codon:yes gene_type:complete